MTLSGSNGITFNDASTQSTGKQACKAWVNFNGVGSNGSSTINASYNVSSVTKNGSGDYTVTYTNAMPSANYSISAIPCTTDFAGSNDAAVISSTYTPTTTTYRFKTVIALWSGSASTVNCNSVNFIVFSS